MTCLTTNHPNRTYTVHMISRQGEVHFTYINAERIWPVRDAAVRYADQLLNAPFAARAAAAR